MKTKTRVRGCAASALVLAILGSGAVWWLLRAGSAEPDYWRERQRYLEQSSPGDRLQVAEAVERRLRQAAQPPPAPEPLEPSAVEAPVTAPPGPRRAPSSEPGPAPEPSRSDLRPEAPRTSSVFFTLEEINAWLERRADELIEELGGDLASSIRDPMLAIEGQQLVLAFRLQRPSIDVLMSVPFSVAVEGGRGEVRISGVRVGSLPLPGIGAGSSALLRAGGGSLSERVGRRLVELGQGRTFDAVVELDGQHIRVQSIEVQPGGVLLTIEQPP